MVYESISELGKEKIGYDAIDSPYGTHKPSDEPESMYAEDKAYSSKQDEPEGGDIYTTMKADEENKKQDEKFKPIDDVIDEQQKLIEASAATKQEESGGIETYLKEIKTARKEEQHEEATS